MELKFLQPFFSSSSGQNEHHQQQETQADDQMGSFYDNLEMKQDTPGLPHLMELIDGIEPPFENLISTIIQEIERTANFVKVCSKSKIELLNVDTRLKVSIQLNIHNLRYY